MSKYKLPKCPYCKTEYNNFKILAPLAYNGWEKENKVKCAKCGEAFTVSIKIMYYGRKK